MKREPKYKSNPDDDNFRRDMEELADEIEDKKPFVTAGELKVQATYIKLKEEDERIDLTIKS